MKKCFALLLILCLLPLGALAAVEKLPKVKFPNKNYVGYSGYDFSLKMTVTNNGSFTGAKTFKLVDQNGRVWVEKEAKKQLSALSFKIPLDVSHEGGYTLSVWCDDVQVSSNTAYLAVTDKHRKAIQTVEIDAPFMSLSFDCAYDESNTDALLAVLDELNIKATFFMTGGFVLNFTEQAKKIRDAGHEIGCHSVSHPHLLDKTLDERFRQVRRNVEIIREELGVIPRLFRPPFGEFNVTVSAPARAEGMEICMWSIDSHDWDTAYNKEKVIKRVTKDVGPGTIILFHLDGFDTIEVLPEVVPYYRDTLGLEFVPITELIAMSDRQLPPSPYEN